MKVRVLGCGDSLATPALSNGWGACDPAEPRNLRFRASLLLTIKNKHLLVDTGPDVRMQLWNAGIQDIDGIFITHTHFDHIGGLPEVRPLSRRFFDRTQRRLPLFASEDSINRIKELFPYVLSEYLNSSEYPMVEMIPVEEGFEFEREKITLQDHDHGFSLVKTLRIRDFAYTTDVRYLKAENFDFLKDLDTWIVAAIGYKALKVHAPLSEVLEWVERISPRRTFLTHMRNGLDYRTLMDTLPQGVWPCFDGMELEF